jgi:hypothetical protein
VLAAAAGAALPAAKVCRAAGLDAAGAQKAYGANARIVPVVPNTCEVVLPVKHGASASNDEVASVAFYPKTEWSEITGEDRRQAQRVVYLHGLGNAAVLFDTAKAPFYYQEQVDFIARSLAIVITPQGAVTATGPPRAPEAEVSALAQAIHTKLG